MTTPGVAVKKEEVKEEEEELAGEQRMPYRGFAARARFGPRSMRHTIRGEGLGQGNGQADGRALEEGHEAIGKILVGEDALCGHVRETGEEPGMHT